MRAVVQRADGAAVHVSGEQVGGFAGPGLVVLVGVTHDDTIETAKKMAAKVWGLRLFDRATLPSEALAQASESRELSASDANLPLLVVSQFTLYGDAKRGRRPTWDAAAPGDVAEPLVDAVVSELRVLGATVTTGVFGADMRVSLVNDGPFTALLEL